jgi:YD repeat-containing protein
LADTDTFTYTYNADGEILTASDNSGGYTLTYDALDRLSSQTDLWGLTITFGYRGSAATKEEEDNSMMLSMAA